MGAGPLGHADHHAGPVFSGVDVGRDIAARHGNILAVTAGDLGGVEVGTSDFASCDLTSGDLASRDLTTGDLAAPHVAADHDAVIGGRRVLTTAGGRPCPSDRRRSRQE